MLEFNFGVNFAKKCQRMEPTRKTKIAFKDGFILVYVAEYHDWLSKCFLLTG